MFLTFQVRDTGPGIAPEEIADLFESFSQTETGRQAQEGTGLGLPISRKFVQLMGGDIQVESHLGQGTSFHFEIAVEVLDEAHVETPPPLGQRQVIALEPDQPRYRVLVVDDQPTNRQLLLKLLTPIGFDLKEAENGQQALAIWAAWQPHLIWMDMRMPVMDGYQTAQRIKAQASAATDPARRTKIIALTASSYEEERINILASGCDDYLRKPFRAADIFALMTRHIGASFIYGEAEAVSPIKPASYAEDDLRPARLATLPPDLLTRLVHSVETLDLGQIAAHLDEIEPLQPDLVAGLEQLVRDFQFDELLALLEAARAKSTT
jgi:CheY-like chemotaxis protein